MTHYYRDYGHEGLLLPEKDNPRRELARLINQTYSSLPLQESSVGYDALLGVRTIVAPPGKVFKMTGKFSIESEGTDFNDCYGPPEDSLDILVERLEELPLYQRLLEITDDKAKIISFLYAVAHKDYETSPEYLESAGFRLTKARKREFSEHKPKYDYRGEFIGRELRVTGQLDSRRNPKVGVIVMGQPTMWTDSGLLPIAFPIAESDEDKLYFVDVKSEMHSTREIALASSENATIQICDEPADFNQLVVAKDKSWFRGKQFWTPADDGATSHQYVEFAYNGLVKDPDRLEQLRLHEMRIHRQRGDPFPDDPMPHFKIPNGISRDYYLGKKVLGQIITPRQETTWGRHEPAVSRIINALHRYIGREVTPETYGESLKAFRPDGAFKLQPAIATLHSHRDDEPTHETPKKLINVKGVLFYFEQA